MTAWTHSAIAGAVARVKAAGWDVGAIGDEWILTPPGAVDANGAPLGKRGHRVTGGVDALVAFVQGWEAGSSNGK